MGVDTEGLCLDSESACLPPRWFKSTPYIVAFIQRLDLHEPDMHDKTCKTLLQE